MKRVVIFGVGNNWKKYGNIVRKKFSIVGYIDNQWYKIGNIGGRNNLGLQP